MIAVIMLMVVVYALGVEKGKTAARDRADLATEHTAVAIKASQDIRMQKAPQFISTAPIARVKPVAVVKEAPVPAATVRAKPLPPDQNSSLPYTIVAVTFVRKESAQNEVERLKRENIIAYVFFSDPYYQVRIGYYPDKTGASSLEGLKKVKKRYKDAYFKLR